MPELDIHHLRVPLHCWLDVQLETGGPGEPTADGGITVTLNVVAMDVVIRGDHGDEILRAELPLTGSAPAVRAQIDDAAGTAQTLRAQVEKGATGQLGLTQDAAATLADKYFAVPADQQQTNYPPGDVAAGPVMHLAENGQWEPAADTPTYGAGAAGTSIPTASDAG